MQLAAPEDFKESEEAVSGSSTSMTELPFINVLYHLWKAGIAVPRLYYYDQAAGLLYLEDFGDVTLSEAYRELQEPDRSALYHQAITTLARIHTKATSLSNQGCLAFHRGFDVPLLMWEFDHFLEFGVEARQEKPIPEGEKLVIRSEFHRIAELMASQPKVFTHRDYHSRNLMVVGTRLGIIDFQDALMGPASYDVASLLRDAYIQLEEPLIEELIRLYLTETAREKPLGYREPDFRRLFDFTSIQRNLKAAGRFVYIDRVKQNPKFLADIPRTLGYVRRNLAKYPELITLHKHLAPYVPELR